METAPVHAGIVRELELEMEDSAAGEAGDYVCDHFGAGWNSTPSSSGRAAFRTWRRKDRLQQVVVFHVLY
jgi:hypothetical protein